MTHHFDVKFQQLHNGATIPQRGTDGSAGYDLYASQDITIPSGETRTIPLGFATSMPELIHARIESRSGMALRGGVVLTGVIDSDYRGEWKVIMRNFGAEPLVLARGERVAQAVFRHTLAVAFQPVSELSGSTRAGGFGSTGR